MAVLIRMKKFGRKHRPYYRICAMDQRTARGGKVLEELGVYDPMVRDTDARAILKPDRISYWLSVGAQPSDKVQVLIKKYGPEGTHVEAQRAALDRLAQPRAIPDPGAPASLPKKKEEPKPASAPAETAEAPAANAEEAPSAEPAAAGAEAPAAGVAEAASSDEAAAAEEKPPEQA